MNFNSHFRLDNKYSKNEKKTQHGVVGAEKRREDLRECALSIGDGYNALENAPVVHQTPNSRRERVV